jgi:hypothetical protein
MKPTLQQQKDFLLQTYFGTRGDELDRFISRAYRDMNRTLHHIAKLPKSDKARILNGAKNLVKAGINDLSKKNFPVNPMLACQDFDQWHSDLCHALKTYYATELQNLHSEIRLTYGQAQKWVNMTMKYCWVCGGADVAGIEPWYSVAHVAVDEVILVTAEKSGVVKVQPCGKWSAWDDQQAYQNFQDTLRQTAAKQPQSPLELEYDWWLKYRSQVTGDGNED